MSRKQKRTRKKGALDKKLLGYSAAAGAALAVGGTAQAEIIHTPVNVPLAGVAPYDIDFDGPGGPMGPKFSAALNSSYWGPTYFFRTAAFRQKINGVGSVAMSGNYAVPLLASTLVQNQTFGNDPQHVLAAFGNYGGNTYQQGLFAGLGDRYIGVKFPHGGNDYYGWVLVNVAAEVTQFTLKGFAYNDVPDGGICAGQVPEPGSLALLAAGAAGLLLRRRKQAK